MEIEDLTKLFKSNAEEVISRKISEMVGRELVFSKVEENSKGGITIYAVAGSVKYSISTFSKVIRKALMELKMGDMFEIISKKAQKSGHSYYMVRKL